MTTSFLCAPLSTYKHPAQNLCSLASSSLHSRNAQPSAQPSGHVTSPTTGRAYSSHHPLAAVQQQQRPHQQQQYKDSHPSTHAPPPHIGAPYTLPHHSINAQQQQQSRSALHAALYGPRPSIGGTGGMLGNPATGVFKTYDGGVSSKVALAEGQPLQGVCVV